MFYFFDIITKCTHNKIINLVLKMIVDLLLVALIPVLLLSAVLLITLGFDWSSTGCMFLLYLVIRLLKRRAE